MAKKQPDTTFAEKIVELEQVVAALESPDTELEISLSEFERGIRLIRATQKELSQTEQRVQQLLEDAETPNPQEEAES